MSKLTYIKDFDTYFGEQVFEGLNSNEEEEMYRIFAAPGPITMSDGVKIEPSTIWDWIKGAFSYINQNFSVLYYRFATKMNIILFRHCSELQTMAVDGHLNLYINAEFVYNLSKVASAKVKERGQASDLTRFIAAILMHELYHVVYNHVQRGKDWVFKHNSTWSVMKNDLNLASDMEVNQTLINTHTVTEPELTEKIKGIYLRSELKDKNSGQSWTAIRTMEDILADENVMNVLRSMHPAPPNGLINKDDEQNNDKEQETKKTTSEWDKGYKDAWQKLAELFRKYGHSGVWKKLQEKGIINAIGEYDPEHDTKEIMSMEFFTIKSFDEFINGNDIFESVDSSESIESGEKGLSTYEEGFNAAVEKIMGALRSSMMGGDGEGGENGGSGPNQKIESDLNEDDLDPIDIPRKMKKQKGGTESGDTPGQIMGGETDDDDNNDDDDDNNESQQGGSGGSIKKKKASDEKIQKNKNKLMNGSSDNSSDSDSDSNSGPKEDKPNSSSKDGSIGGTGTFIDSDSKDGQSMIGAACKESGYDASAMKKITDIIKQAQTDNTEDKISYARERFKVEDKTGAGKFMKDLDKKIDQNYTKKMWKEIMKKFLDKTSRHANSAKKINGPFNKWVVTKPYRNVQGIYNTKKKKVSQDPQDLNVYVDVSGSVSGAMDLLRTICQTLVVYAKEFEFSNINICPWASTSNGVHPVESLHEQADETKVLNDILDIIARGEAECGGGTAEGAACAAMIQVIKQSLDNPGKMKKDDVHVIITDGQFNYKDIESRMDSMISNYFHNNSVGHTAIKNTFWMLYDADRYKDEWTDEIRSGKIIFLNTSDFQKK